MVGDAWTATTAVPSDHSAGPAGPTTAMCMSWSEDVVVALETLSSTFGPTAVGAIGHAAHAE
jgi:hypothetical protein